MLSLLAEVGGRVVDHALSLTGDVPGPGGYVAAIKAAQQGLKASHFQLRKSHLPDC